METQGSETDSVLERLQKLEKRNRQLGWAVLGLLLLVVVSAVAAGLSWKRALSPTGELAVQRLELLGDDGTPRAVLAPAGEDASLVIYDGNGRQRLILGINEGRSGMKLLSGHDQPQVNLTAGMDGAELAFFDAGGKERASMGVVRDLPGLVLRDASALPRAEINTKDNGGRLLFRDDNGKTRAEWVVGRDRTELSFVDPEGKPMVAISSANDRNVVAVSGTRAVPQVQLGVSGSEPTLLLLDDMGRRRTDLRVQSDGTAGLFMMNQREKARLELGTNGADGLPLIALRDEDQKLRGVFRLEGDGTPRLALLNAAEVPRCILQAGSDTSELILNSNRAGLGMALSVFDDKEFLVFLDGNDNQRLGLGIVDNNPTQIFFDAQGRAIWTAP